MSYTYKYQRDYEFLDEDGDRHKIVFIDETVNPRRGDEYPYLIVDWDEDAKTWINTDWRSEEDVDELHAKPYVEPRKWVISASGIVDGPELTVGESVKVIEAT